MSTESSKPVADISGSAGSHLGGGAAPAGAVPAAPPAKPPVPATPAAPASVPAPRSEGKAEKKSGSKIDADHLAAVKHTRTGATWTAIFVGSLLLIVLLVFIVQNQEPTKVVFLQWDVSLPLGVLLLVAAIIGVLGTSLVGAARMVQVWRAARKSAKA